MPIGIGAGVYLAEYAKEGKSLTIFEISIESLSSLPSIVIGLFGYLVFIMWTGMSWNILAGALTISILSIPLITTETNNAIRALPVEYKEGSLGLGATKFRNHPQGLDSGGHAADLDRGNHGCRARFR